MRFRILQGVATAGAAGLLAMLLADSASSQVLPGKRADAPPAPPAAPRAQPAAPSAPAAPRDAVKGVRDAPPAARREAARDAARDAQAAPAEARRDARENVRDARQDARETGREAREGQRDARQDRRQAARDFNRATRAADLGVWFNTRAAQGVAAGLAIADLAVNGPFATAGFREGDRLVSINGQPITTEAQFVQLLTAPTREQISVVVFRDGQQQTIQLQPTVIEQAIVNNDPFFHYGILVDDRSPDRIVVTRVFPRTPAFYAGLRPGDVITTVGGQPVTGIQAFSTLLADADDVLALQVTRNGQMREIDLDTTLSGSVRTALRPDLDAQGQLRGDARIGTERSGTIGGTTPGAATGTATVPGAAAQGARATNPTAPIPGSRAIPTSPTAPGAPTNPAITPTQPVPPGTPTRPVPPGTPTSPSQPRQPLPGAPAAAPGAPTAPAAPAAPRAGTGTGATGGTGASAGGAGAIGGTGAQGGAGASAGGAGATGGTGATGGAGTTGGTGAGAGGSGGASSGTGTP